MLRTALVAALMAVSTGSLAGEAENRALANCLIAESSVAMILNAIPVLEAYNSAWDSCAAEATLVSSDAAPGHDLSPRDAVDEHAYIIVNDLDDALRP